MSSTRCQQHLSRAPVCFLSEPLHTSLVCAHPSLQLDNDLLSLAYLYGANPVVTDWSPDVPAHAAKLSTLEPNPLLF